MKQKIYFDVIPTLSNYFSRGGKFFVLCSIALDKSVKFAWNLNHLLRYLVTCLESWHFFGSFSYLVQSWHFFWDFFSPCPELFPDFFYLVQIFSRFFLPCPKDEAALVPVLKTTGHPEKTSDQNSEFWIDRVPQWLDLCSLD